MKQNIFMDVSVVIVSRNRHRELLNAIKSVKEVEYNKGNLEIVVVEEAEEREIIDGVKYIHIPKKAKPDFGFARNIGVKNASGKIIIFTDDDCLVEKDWVKRIVGSFQEDVMAVAGGVKVKDCTYIGYCESILGFPGGGIKKITEAKGKIMPTDQISTCNAAFMKKVFDEVGYFKENTPFSGEDYDFAQRVCKKYKCLYNPSAIVYHRPRGSLWKIFKWFIRRGICEVYLIKMGTNKIGPHVWYNIKNSIILRLFLMIIILDMIDLNRTYVYIGLFMFYYLSILLRYKFQLKIYRSIKMFILTPVVKFIMDLGIDCGRFMGPWIVLQKGDN